MTEIITERDIYDPLTVTVDCELGTALCTGADYAAEMVWDYDGWICPSCEQSEARHWDESHTPRALGLT